MKPINWHPKEQTLNPPPGSEDTIEPLPVLPLTYEDGTHAIVSCWQLSFKDLLRVLFTRRMYVAVMGQGQPPLMLRTHPVEVGIPLESWKG